MMTVPRGEKVSNPANEAPTAAAQQMLQSEKDRATVVRATILSATRKSNSLGRDLSLGQI